LVIYKPIKKVKKEKTTPKYIIKQVEYEKNMIEALKLIKLGFKDSFIAFKCKLK